MRGVTAVAGVLVSEVVESFVVFVVDARDAVSAEGEVVVAVVVVVVVVVVSVAVPAIVVVVPVAVPIVEPSSLCLRLRAW